MPTECIAFKKTNYFSSLICDYLEENKELQPFYNNFPKLENFKKQIEEKTASVKSESRIILSEALKAQYQNTKASPLTLQNIEALKAQLLAVFWEKPDPTQGMRQGNDIGTQYRSALYLFSDEQYQTAIASKARYEALLGDQFGTITTDILPAGAYYLAEEYHQQYLAKNPDGYCGLGGTGVCFI